MAASVIFRFVENERVWGIVSRGDFKGTEIDQLDEEDHLWECIR